MAAIHESKLDESRPLDPRALAALDHFHTGGITGTEELARLCSIGPETRVLDIGAGMAGAARFLAHEFGCEVDCVEPVEDFRDAALLLNELCDLEQAVRVHAGSALELPFEDATFDLVWMQNVSMNIQDKRRLYAEIRRVLRPGGTYAFHEVFAGPVQPLHFPVPWASGADMNFLVTPSEAREFLESAGLHIERFEERPQLPAAAASTPGPLGFAVFMPDIAEKRQNGMRNQSEDRVTSVRAICTAV